MVVDMRSSESVYITINDWVYYIDDSTGEQIIQKWRKKKKSRKSVAKDRFWEDMEKRYEVR
jgi:hypothetical protein